MAGPGVYQPFLGRAISIIQVKEVRGQELHAILNILDTVNTSWYVYKRAHTAHTFLVEDLFGTETDPNGHIRLLASDGRSPSIRDRHNPDNFRHLPNLVLLWLWMGLSLTQITMRYIRKHPSSMHAATFTLLEARWGSNCVQAVVDHGFVHFLGKEENDSNFVELVFDQHLRNWCLPVTFTPIPRHIAQWLASEAYRLGMEQLDLSGAL